MLQTIRRWFDGLFTLPTMPDAVIDDESRDRIVRLNAMYDDMNRLTHAEWLAKWRPDDPIG